MLAGKLAGICRLAAELPVLMENEPKPSANTTKAPAQFAAEPMPAQTVEIIRPFDANPNQAALNLSYECTPDSRLIWTNDNLVALESLLTGDDSYPSLEGMV